MPETKLDAILTATRDRVAGLRAQARELERLGCTHAQGYLFSRPLATSAVEQLLVANRPLGPKNVQPSEPLVSTGDEPELYYRSTPFEWPAELQPAARS